MRTREDVLTDLVVTGAQAGDQRSFTLLYRQWNPVLIRYAARLTRDMAAPADIMQESWIAIAKGLGRLSDTSKFKSWSYQIVSNKCRDWIRVEQSRRRLHESEALSEVQPNTEAMQNPVSIIKTALQDLPDDQRTILTLFYLEELGVHMIGVILNIPDGTVKSRLYHARKTLRGVLEKRKDE